MNRDTTEPDTAALSGLNVEKWVEFHHEHTTSSEYSHEFAWDVTVEADGPFVTDVDGNTLSDFTHHIGTALLSHNNGKVLSKLREFDLVEPMKAARQDMYFRANPDPETAEFSGASHLMDKLIDVPSHCGMDAVFLLNSRAEAVESAAKTAHGHEAPTKYGYAFERGFYGRTSGALLLTKSEEVYTCHYPRVAGIGTAPFYADSDCSGDDDACDCDFLADDGLRLRNSLSPRGGHVNPDEAAFTILEPIQGVDGYRFLSEAFMAEMDDVCDTYDILLVVDEIQSGVGRIGEMRAVDHYPIEPDVIANAKGLRTSATVSWTDMLPTEKNRLGSTFGGGDLLASIQGALTLDVIKEYDLFNNAIEYGRQAREFLADGASGHMVDVCDKGLMLVVEFDTKECHDAVVEAALDRGLLTLGCGEKTIRPLPPLDSTKRGIELDMGTFCEMMDAVATEVVA